MTFKKPQQVRVHLREKKITECPRCGSKLVYVYWQRGTPGRRHRCKACGWSVVK